MHCLCARAEGQAHLFGHTERCVFIGYPDGYKGWKFYNPTTKKVVISEHADFDERYFPGLKHSATTLPPSSTFVPIPIVPVLDPPPPNQGGDQAPAIQPVSGDLAPVNRPPSPPIRPPSPPPAPFVPLALRRGKRAIQPPKQYWKLPVKPTSCRG
jgi:hypothetical protein